MTLYERMGLDVALLAPTGRAAQRLGEVTGREAQTIHRCLGMSCKELTGQTAFSKNAQDPLEVHAVIVDEMSMVDIELMRSLLEAMRPGSRLVLVGDPDQLPSVGPGNVLGDMLRSGVVPVVSLTQVFRQAEQSAIIRAAHAVDRGSCRRWRIAAAAISSCAAVRRIDWCRRWWSCAATACPKTWVFPPSRYRCCPPPERAPAVRRR